ncbi:MAG: hypothetical protein Q7U47_11825, partial [Paludibacter sp.]|nr:hypothetical protein [Paludibacter sp.]
MKNLTKILCIFFLTIICLTVNAQKNTTFLEKIFKKSKPVSVVESDGRFFVNKIDSIDTGTLRKTAVALPDLTFTTNYSDDPNDRLLFKYCDNDSKPRGLRVLPTDTTYAKYKVTWGDGTSNFEGTYRELIGTLHSYASGKYVLVYSVFFNETWYSQGYTIFAGQAPNVNILNPGRNEICIGDSLKFTLSGANVKGTTYTVIFSDDPTKPLKYNDDNPLPASITHKYLKNSCGSNFTSGKTSFPNAFGVTVLATNSCGTSSANVGPIYVSSEPKPKITLPEKKCIGEIVTITNSTTVATTPDQTSGNCTTAFKKIWIINADTSDYTIIKGDLGGTNFPTDPTDPDFWYSGSNVLEVKFNRSGRYTIRLLMANTCFMKEIPQVIIIEPEIDPTFTAITETNECGNLIVQATNKTVIDNAQFDPKNLPVFSWSVSPSGNYFIGGTNANSANPKFNFTVPGNYTVSLTYTGTSCLPTIATQDFIVQGNPIASINGMSACTQSDDTARVVATALINTYGLEIQNRLWKIIDMNGSVIFTSSDPAPLFKFTSTIAGNYKAQLTIETTCGTTTAIRNFVVALMPVLNAES